MTASPARPSRMASVIHELPMLRTADPELNYARGVELHGHLSTAKEAAQRYRDAVFAHPDLKERAEKTCHGRFTGYISPRTDGFGAYNSSPYRAALVEIVTEALTRDNDWRHYDSDRLGSVPARHIRAPWTEPRDTQPAGKGEALWHESDQ